jgi:hypothetical protein
MRGSGRERMIEKLLIHFDVGPLGAAYRAALGAALVAALGRLAPGAGLGTAIVALLGVLFALKAGAAVTRRLARAPAAVRAHWDWRRALARRHDSYQWRKLLWVGAGILAAGAVGGAPAWSRPLGIACVLCGIAGELSWRRLGVGLQPPSQA